MVAVKEIMKFYQNKGFTLIEIIIALFIFAILGTIAAIGLHEVIRTHRRVMQTDKKISRLLLSMTLMRRDFLQITDRPITSTSGGVLPALVSTDRHHIEFTASGYANPFAMSKRGTLHRVAYTLTNKKLVRLSWSLLDRPPHVEPSHRVLLNGVTGMNLSFVDNKNQVINVWAPNSSVGALPRAIILTITLGHRKKLRNVFPIAGRGVDDQ